MKKIGFILMFFAVFVLSSCTVDHCDVLCDSGPLGLSFELLDKTTGKNLFTNGTFERNDIEVLDLDNNNSMVEYGFISENVINLITLGPFGWEKKIANYSLKVDTLNIFTLNVDAEEKTEDCCSFVQVNKVEIKNAESQQNPETGVYEVFVEL